MNSKISATISAALTAVLIFSVSASALPTASSNSGNATTVDTVIENVFQDNVPAFSDITTSDWFYGDVMRLASAKVLNGYPDGTFRPANEITNAEFTKVLLTSMSITPLASYANPLFPESWASAYITHAEKLDIITEDMLLNGFTPDTPITRAVMTEMTVRALQLPTPDFSETPFTDTSDKYAAAAYREYILRGYPAENGTRICKGDSHALRSEAAAIAIRIIEYCSDPYSYKKDAILENASRYPLTLESEFLDLFHILNREFMTEFTFSTPLSYEIWSEYYRLSNVLYLEYYYSAYLNCSYRKNSDVYNITLEYTGDRDVLKGYHISAENMADTVLSLIITEDMSDTDKAKAIHDYLVLNCEYDYNNYSGNTMTFESRIAYGALCQRTAICQGYCAAFNMLARRAGLKTTVVTGYAPGSTDKHAWNMVLIDDEILFIDTTHDDPVPDRKGSVSYKYFMLTEEQMLELGYTWEPGQIQLKYLY